MASPEVATTSSLKVGLVSSQSIKSNTAWTNGMVTPDSDLGGRLRERMTCRSFLEAGMGPVTGRFSGWSVI